MPVASSAAPRRGWRQFLSAAALRATRIRWRPWKDRLIRWFVGHYQVDMTLALDPDPDAYPDFNAFFTRALRPDARPLDPDPTSILCPVDGALGEYGAIQGGVLLQAKGRRYSLAALLGGDPQQAAVFRAGSFATLYLSPRDYHRVHMPLSGRLREMIYVPGMLFSVRPRVLTRVDSLFARNERVISIFDTAHGPLAMILVGAVMVGGIEQVWAGRITPPRGAAIRHWSYGDTDPTIQLERGEEMGRFSMGSTVIMLLGKGLDWEDDLHPGRALCMGEALAHAAPGTYLVENSPSPSPASAQASPGLSATKTSTPAAESSAAVSDNGKPITPE